MCFDQDEIEFSVNFKNQKKLLIKIFDFETEEEPQQIHTKIPRNFLVLDLKNLIGDQLRIQKDSQIWFFLSTTNDPIKLKGEENFSSFEENVGEIAIYKLYKVQLRWCEEKKSLITDLNITIVNLILNCFPKFNKTQIGKYKIIYKETILESNKKLSDYSKFFDFKGSSLKIKMTSGKKIQLNIKNFKPKELVLEIEKKTLVNEFIELLKKRLTTPDKISLEILYQGKKVGGDIDLYKLSDEDISLDLKLRVKLLIFDISSNMQIGQIKISNTSDFEKTKKRISTKANHLNDNLLLIYNDKQKSIIKMRQFFLSDKIFVDFLITVIIVADKKNFEINVTRRIKIKNLKQEINDLGK